MLYWSGTRVDHLVGHTGGIFCVFISFPSRWLISFSKFDLSDFSLLCFDEIPHEKADLHGLKVQIFLVCPSFKWQFPHANKCPLFYCDCSFILS